MDYTCTECGGVFTSDWTDKEAKQEAASLFGQWTTKMDLVCDDCYKSLLLGAAKAHHLTYTK